MSRFLLFLISLMLSFASLTAQEDFMSNRDNPQAILPQLTADPNSTVSVPLTINNMSKVKSLSVIYTFDPQILTYSSSSISGGVLTASMYNYLIEVIDGNKIKFTFNAKNTLFMYTGSGLVGTINFETGSYGTSPLIFTEILINTVTYLGNAINGEVHITPCYTAIADAGPDASITVGQIYLLNGNATNHSSVEWATQGDGVFSNTNILKPYYTPGSQDIANGGVSLCLTANGFSPCGGTTDCMYLSILPEGTGAFGMLPNLYADPGSTVIIPVQAHLLKSVTNLNITISYDSKILTYSNFDFNNSVLTNSLYNREFNFIAPGLVQFNFQCKSPAFTYTGSGVVGNIIFAVGNFGISPIVFEEFTINNDNNTELCVNGQVYVSDCFNAVAFAGANQTICEDETATLNGSANYYQSLKWVTTGDGSFSDITSQNTIYTPGAQDISAGNVELCLIAYTNTPCMNDTSCLQLSIAQIPEVTLEPFDEYCEGDEPFTLTGGSPEGGVYYVDGQEADIFDPSLAGTYNILYVYTNEYGCTGSATEQIIVNPTPDVTLEPFDEYCEGDEPFTLTGGSPEGGVYYVDGQEADTFDPSLAGTYNILYVYTNEYGCTGLATEQIIVNPTPDVTLEPFDEYCEGDEPFTLTGGSPEGGVYYVDGQEADIFDPSLAGTYNILYVYINEYGCTGSATEQIIVNPLPIVTCPDDLQICINTSPFVITGAEPSGGIYSGNGVEDGFFHPEVAGLGEHEITYNYEDLNGCSGMCSFIIIVAPLPTVDAGEDATICQDGSGYQLNGSVENAQSFFWYTLMGTGDFDNQNVLNPIYTPGQGDYIIGSVELCLNAISEPPCDEDITDCMTLYFYPKPVITCPPDLSVCIDEDPFLLSGASPEGGYYSGPGVLNNIFDPQSAGAGNHQITYINIDSNGCLGECTFTVSVVPLPTVDAGEDATICQDGSGYQLNGSVENAQSFFWYTLMGIGDFDNQNVLNPIYTPGPGDYIIGSVELCLNAISEPPCDEDITDCMTLYFYPKPVITCPPDLSVCINEDPFLLSGASPEGGYYSGPGVLNNIFDPQSAGAGNHQITYINIDSNGCLGECTFTVSVVPLPTVDAGEDATICQDGSGYQLNGSAENAQSFFWYTLMGTGDFDNQNVLNPIYTPGPGDYIIGSVELCLNAISEPPCDEDITDCMTLYFYPKPVITCPPDLSVCIDEDPFLLSGASPEGGYYSGPGVLNNIFDPQSAGAGNHQITYDYIDYNACPAQCTFHITVNPLPEFDCPEYGPFCQGDPAIVFEETGVFTLNGDVVTGFDPVEAGEYTLVYTETNAFGCEASCEFVIVVNPLPEFDCPEYGPFCQGDPAIVFEETGVFTLNGDVVTGFDPVAAGEFTLVYTETNAFGCEANCEFVIVVNPLPTVNAGPNLTIPYGASVTISGASASGIEPLSYFWSPPSAFIDNTLLNPTTINLTESAIYALTVTDGNGCSNEDQMEIIIAAGELSVNPNASEEEICLGQSTQLFANASGGTGNYSYSWSSDPIGFSSNQANPIVNPEITTTYYVEVNDGYNTVTGNITITVNPLPVIDCPEYGPFCQGDPAIVFEETGVFTFNGDVVTGFDPVEAGEYILVYTETNAFGCEASCEFVIVVNPLPEFDCPEYGPFCQGNPAIVFEETGVFTLNGDVVTGFDPVAAGEYNLVYTETNAFGCEASCEFVIVVNPLPTVNAGPNLTIPYGTSVTISGASASGIEPLSYFWSPPSAFIDNTILNPTTINLTESAIYTLTVTDGNGCSNEDQMEIIITVEELSVNPTASEEEICLGQYTQLFANASGGTGNYSYSWSSDPIGFSSNQANPIVNPEITTTYYVEVNDGNNTVTGNITITVNPLPVIDCPEYGPFCQGDPAIVFEETGVFTLNGDVVTGFDPVAAGEYNFVYTETNAFGCEANCEFVIVVNPLPEFDCPEYGPFCQGDPAIVFEETGVFTLNGDVVTGFDPVAAGEYNFVYTETNAFGCEANCEFVIVVNPLPTVNAGPNLTIPYGASVTISGASASGIEPLSYFWSPPSAFIDNTLLNPTTINLTESAIYALTVTDGNGCSNEDQMEIIIAAGELSVNPNASEEEICLGQSTQLFANASGGTGNYSYSWSSDPIGFSSNQANPIVNPEITTTYYVEVNDGYNTVTGNITITVNPLPVIDCPEYGPFCQGDPAIVFEETGVFTFNGDVVTGFDPVEAGEYILVYTETNAFGCEASCEFVIVVNPLPEFDCPEYGPFCQGNPAIVFEETGVFTLNGDVVTGFDPVAAGEYNLVYTETNAFGCEASCEFVIVVNPLPTVNAGPNLTIPYGTSVTISGASASGIEPLSYFWSPPSAFIDNTILNPTTINLTESAIYTLTVTDGNGCSNEDQMEIIITVEELSVNPTASEEEICLGQYTQLFANASGGTGNYSYSWSSDPIGFSSNQANPIVNPEITTTYYVEVNDGNNTVTGNITITVNPLPVIDCPEYGPFCQGDPAIVFEETGVFTLNGDVVTGFDPVAAGEYNFVYTETNAFGCEANCEFVIVVNPLPEFDCPEYGPFCQGDPAIVFEETGVFTLNGDVVTGFDPVAAGEYNFVYTETNAFGCEASCEFVIVVNPLPIVNAGPNLTIPYGASVTISGASASGIEPLSYFWSPPSAFIDNTILNPTTINLTESAIYTLTVTDGNGCSNEDQMEIIITVEELSVNPNASEEEICLGQSTQLFANASGGTGNYSYSWSSDPIGFSSNQANPIVNPEITTTYYVEVNDGYNTVTGNITITVNPLPVIDCPEYGPFCQGDPAIVFEETGVFTFNGDVVTGFDPVAAGEYILVYTETNAFGCVASCEFVIVVNPLPEFDCPEYGPFCQGNPAIVFEETGVFTLNGDVVTGFDPVAAGEYNFVYTETNAFGCEASCEFVIVVNPLPTVNAGPNLTIPYGASVTISGASASGIEPLSYFWSPPSAFIDNTILNPTTINLTESAIYTLTVTDGNGCSNEDQMEIIITVEELSVNPNASEEEICLGQSTQLFANASGGTGNYSYSWSSDPVGFSSNQANPIVNPEITTTYYVEVNDGYNTATGNITITVNPLPVIDCPEYGPFCQGDPAIVFEETGVFTFNGDVVTGFDPVEAGEYILVYTETNTFGCEASCEFVIVVNPLPEFDCPEYGPFCQGNPAIVFEETGVFTLNGDVVTGFDPVEAGEYNLVYTETNAFGCEASCEFVIVVNPLPEFDCPEYGPFCQGDPAIVFEETGVFTFNGDVVTGFDPVAAGEYILVYTETNAFGCEASCEFVIVVNPLPVIDCPEYGPLCQGDPAIVFDETGVFTLNGDVVTAFDPVAAGEYTLVYTETNAFGCEASCEFVIVVNPLPVIDCPEYGPLCQGDPAIVFEETGVFTLNGDVVTGFDPVAAGDYTLVYTETNAFGCDNSCSFIIKVLPVPVILSQPESVAELYGYDITFSITADFATSIEWYGPDGLIMTDENVTTSVLSIEKITLNDVGEYYCKVINECGFLFSDTVYLEVLPWTQIIDLPSYLNGVSTYLDLIDCDVETIMSQLENELLALEFIKKVYVPGSITFCWNEAEGAKLYLKEDTWPTEFSVTGYPTLGTEMPIKAGWSIIPVWSSEPVYAQDIFEQLGNNLIIAVSINYNEVYWPQGNIHTLNYLEPGRAYLVKVNNEATVMWNTITVSHAIHHPDMTNTSIWPDPNITGNFHLISISTNAISDLSIGDYIGVFDKNGTIAGLTEVTDFSENILLIAFADDNYSGKINDLSNNGKMYFKVYKPSTGEVNNIQPLFSENMPNSDLFYTYGMSMIESINGEKASVEEVLNSTYYINIHPNPVENTTYLTSNKKIQSVKLLNVTGQEMMKLNIDDTHGELDLSRFKSGSYIVQIQFENGLIVTRQLIIK